MKRTSMQVLSKGLLVCTIVFAFLGVAMLITGSYRSVAINTIIVAIALGVTYMMSRGMRVAESIDIYIEL